MYAGIVQYGSSAGKRDMIGTLIERISRVKGDWYVEGINLR